MTKFISAQNLPQNEVSLVAISSIATKQISTLTKMGIECVKVPPCDDLQNGVNTHPDMLLFHKTLNHITLYNYSEDLNSALSSHGFNLEFIQTTLSPEYPHDIALNSFILGDYFVGKRRFSKDLAFVDLNKTCINTKQGYAKCSTIVLSENAVITSDMGICKLLQSRGIDCLLVSTKGISLPEYSCGFIGGCCGKIGGDTLAFSGVLDDYPDKSALNKFCDKHKIGIVYLSDDPICDIGSILPLKEFC